MKILNLLIPSFLKKFSNYLLVNHPFIWKTRIHYILFYAFIANILAITIGLTLPVSLNYIPDYEGVKVISILLMALSGLAYLFWIFLLNRDKKDILTAGRAGTSALIYLVAVFILFTSALTFSHVIRFQVSNLISYQELRADYRQYTQQLSFLSQAKDKVEGQYNKEGFEKYAHKNVKLYADGLAITDNLFHNFEYQTFSRQEIDYRQQVQKERAVKLNQLESLKNIDPEFKEYLIKHFIHPYQVDYVSDYQQWYLEGNNYDADEKKIKLALFASAEVRNLHKKYRINNYAPEHFEKKMNDIIKYRSSAITFPMTHDDYLNLYTVQDHDMAHIDYYTPLANSLYFGAILLFTLVAFITAQLKEFTFKKLIVSIFIGLGSTFTLFIWDGIFRIHLFDRMDSAYAFIFCLALFASVFIARILKKYAGSKISLWMLIFTSINLIPFGFYLVLMIISFSEYPPKSTGIENIPWIVIPVILGMFMISYVILRNINLHPTKK